VHTPNDPTRGTYGDATPPTRRELKTRPLESSQSTTLVQRIRCLARHYLSLARNIDNS